MLIDEVLPRYDVTERHATRVRAPVERVYAALRTLDLSGSPVVRVLFALRSLPALFSRKTRGRALGTGMDALLRSGFVLLGERPNEEIVLGLVGQFWKPVGNIVRVTPDEFRAFGRPGFARAAWNFTLAPQADGSVRLATETRVLCTDAAARRSFRAYWLLIRPFSGLIRLEALRAIRRTAESGAAAAPHPTSP